MKLTLEEAADTAVIVQALAQLAMDGHHEMAKSALEALERLRQRYVSKSSSTTPTPRPKA